MTEGMPQRRLHEGRWVVSRAWIRQLTGASSATVERWYAQRDLQPPQRQHPEVVHTQGRTHYFDQQAIEAFWAAWQEDVGTGRLRTAGRKPGDGNGRYHADRSQRNQAVSVALAALRQEGGHLRGLAARLAREHGGVPRSWQRAVTEARALYEAETSEATTEDL
ncbi:hypothetical protein ABZT03_39535 [Streptomyces sp. NPDC005574]|uniref:hypothetical protein n=1 Tax=Streptomyces sp. NPDC005574 TaxID=3156891 RepID=UPI0033B3DA82